MGSANRSAIQAPNGMPAVSPPATTSTASKPTLRWMVCTAKSMIAERARGKAMMRRQSTYTGLAQPEVNL